MKLASNVAFLKPFLDSSVGMYSPRLKAIRGYRVRKGLTEHSYGSTVRDSNGTYTINIRLYEWDRKKSRYRSLPLATILDTLAHELSHTFYWEHTPEHFAQQTNILKQFSWVVVDLCVPDTSKDFNRVFKVA